MKFLALLILLALPGCNAAGDPNAPRAGLWEARVELVSLNGKKPTVKELALIAHGEMPVERACFDGVAGKVGDQKDNCEVTRFADAGSRVDRVWECKRPANPGKVVSVFTGTRSADAYDFRITTTDRNAEGKPEGMVIVVREQGKRVGDCPGKS